jgi:hypothetical protein
MRAFLGIAVLFAAVAPPADAAVDTTWGGRLSTPQILSASYGLFIGPLDAPAQPPGTPPRETMYIPRGLILQVEPGIGGGKVGVGFAKGVLNVGGAGVQAFYLRTWGKPIFVDKNRSYAGIQADATLFLKLSVGVMRSIDDGPRDTAFTGGIGFGF